MQPDELARACAEKMWGRDETVRALGMSLVSVGPGRATLAMTVRKDMINSHGTCHGGLIFTLADAAFAYACNSRDITTVAQHCSIAFLVAGRLDDVLVAEARETQLVGRTGVYDIAVARTDGVPIAEFRGLSRAVGGAILPPVGG